MSRLEALKDLAERVEAGDPTYWDFSDGFESSHATGAELAFKGSLDAAKALHEAVLPGNAQWWVELRPDGRKLAGVFLGNLGKAYEAYDDNPARAWLLAILRALIAQEEAE
jgi:hypothetical protein